MYLKFALIKIKLSGKFKNGNYNMLVHSKKVRTFQAELSLNLNKLQALLSENQNKNQRLRWKIIKLTYYFSVIFPLYFKKLK